MTLHRVLSLGLAAALAARAPLAVSGDGAWCLSVDSHHVLHRAGLADPSRPANRPRG